MIINTKSVNISEIINKKSRATSLNPNVEITHLTINPKLTSLSSSSM